MPVNLMGKNSNNDNHANQLNPQHEAYWQSRGHDEDAENLAEVERKD